MRRVLRSRYARIVGEAAKTLGELVARMRRDGLRRLEVVDTDPPVVIVTAELAAETDRMLAEQAETLPTRG